MGDISYLLIKKEKSQSQEMTLETDKGTFLKIKILHNKNLYIKKIQNRVPAMKKKFLL